MPDMDALRELYFAGCDPAFFQDDGIDPGAYREDLERLEDYLDNATTWAETINDSKQSDRTEEIRHLVTKAHLLVFDELEDC